MKRGSEHIISSVYAKKLENDRGVFSSFPLAEYMNIPFPNNSHTKKEIIFLNSLPTKENIKFILSADSAVKYFEKELNKIGLNINIKDDEKLKGLLKNIAPFIIILKHHYNRPRPNEISPIQYVWLKSAQSPSYPSGHSTQSRFISLYLANKYPMHKNKIMQIGENVGVSRLMARIHYPSDHIIGKKLANHLFAHYQKYTPLKNQ